MLVHFRWCAGHQIWRARALGHAACIARPHVPLRRSHGDRGVLRGMSFWVTSRSRARPFEIHSKLRRASDFLTTARPRPDPGATFHRRRPPSSALGARTAAHKSRLLPGFCYSPAQICLLLVSNKLMIHVQFVTRRVTNSNTHVQFVTRE